MYNLVKNARISAIFSSRHCHCAIFLPSQHRDVRHLL